MVANSVPIYGSTYQLSVWLGDSLGDYDSKRDVISFEFGDGHHPSNMPSMEVCGFVNRQARWQLISGIGDTDRSLALPPPELAQGSELKQREE